MPWTRRHAPRPRRRAAERGITLLEVLVASAVVGFALLSHAAGTLSGHQLTRAQETRSLALQSIREFVERMRADDDWTGLYARLRYKQDAAAANGGRGYDPTAYYADFTAPRGLSALTVLVQVPSAPAASGALVKVLREDAASPEFGLPFDLSGDGIIDDKSHNLDYVALPIVVRFRWTPPGQAPQELEIHSWLGGNE